jgi:hypothetical protein
MTESHAVTSFRYTVVHCTVRVELCVLEAHGVELCVLEAHGVELCVLEAHGVELCVLEAHGVELCVLKTQEVDQSARGMWSRISSAQNTSSGPKKCSARGIWSRISVLKTQVVDHSA